MSRSPPTKCGGYSLTGYVSVAPRAKNTDPIELRQTNSEMMEVVSSAEEPEETPLPSVQKVMFLGGLFALALLAAVHVGAEIVLPLVLAVVLKLRWSQPCGYWSDGTYRGCSRRCC
jgi:hypothetical protein